MSQFNVFDLNECHKNNLTKFISFIKQKEHKVINEIGYNIDDFYSSNITDTVYNQKDIKEILKKFENNFKSSMSEEINYFTSLQMVYLQLLFHSAEESKVTLTAETSQVENMNNINQINELISMIAQPNISLSDFGKKNNIGKLSSVTNVQTLIEDLESLKEKHEFLLSEFEGLKIKNNFLIKENENLKNNSSQVNQEMTSMSDKINKLSLNSKDEAKYLEEVKKLEFELRETKKTLDSQIEKYQILTNEYDKKLSESVQFKQLRKFITEKNDMINELRSKLAILEKK